MKKGWLLFLTIVLFSLYFLIVKDEKAKVPKIQQSESFLEGVTIVHKKGGKKDWILTAKRADIQGSGDRAELSDIEVKVQDRGIIINADKGAYDMTSKKLTISGPITARDRDYTITSENMQFENTTGILTTDSKVRIEGKKFLLTGTGLQADNNQQKVRILNDVTATFHN